MEYYGNNDYRDYLALRHHGILGMKWGKRNGPPYPLGSSDHSASEKKAGWRKSLSGGDSARSYKKRLNKLDQEATNYIAKMMRAQEEEEKYTEKSNRAYKKGRIGSSKKYAEKALRAQTRKNEARDEGKAITEAQWKMVSEAIRKNYNVRISPTIRNGERARQEVTILLAGALGGTIINSVDMRKFKGKYMTEYNGRMINQSPMIQVGTKFKVSNNKVEGSNHGTLTVVKKRKK